MVIETHTCPRCESSHLTRNGKTKEWKQKFRCQTCGCYGTTNPDYGYSEEWKAEILRAYQERSSLRGLERTFGVARQTVSAWGVPKGHKKKACDFPPSDTKLTSTQLKHVLELDELWSFVQCKASTCWVWVALYRRTKQVVSWFAGDSSADSYRQLWDGIPDAYLCAYTFGKPTRVLLVKTTSQ